MIKKLIGNILFLTMSVPTLLIAEMGRPGEPPPPIKECERAVEAGKCKPARPPRSPEEFEKIMAKAEECIRAKAEELHEDECLRKLKEAQKERESRKARRE